EDEEPLVPKKDTVEFTISTEKAKVEGDRTVTIHVFIRNHSKNTIENLSYYDTLDSNYLYQQSSDSLVTFNTLTQTVNYNIGILEAGEEIKFQYTLRANAQ